MNAKKTLIGLGILAGVIGGGYWLANRFNAKNFRLGVIAGSAVLLGAYTIYSVRTDIVDYFKYNSQQDHIYNMRKLDVDWKKDSLETMVNNYCISSSRAPVKYQK